MGGQSAFGTKAGDLFTKITIGAAAFWIILCMFAVSYLGRGQAVLSEDLGGANQPRQSAPAEPGGSGDSAPAPAESAK
jgi:preprotein translocase subunit SecG